MTSGSKALLLGLSLWLGKTAASEAPDIDALLARLERPAPATIAFREVRSSRLTKRPLVSSGTLEYRGAGRLVRQVEQPYRERTTIDGNAVTVERDGQPPKQFSLERVPELRGLLVGMSAMLGGDRASLEGAFTVVAQADGAHWKMQLTPRDERVRKRVGVLEVDGAADAATCFTVREAGGGESVLMLGPASETPLPDTVAPDWLARHCTGGA